MLTLTMVFTLAACGNSDTTESSAPEESFGEENSVTSEENIPSSESTSPAENTPQAEESSYPETETGSTSLVVYFSWSGNTESVANEIQTQTGADIFEIIPVSAIRIRFLDYEESLWSFYLDYISLMGFWVFLAHYLSKELRKLGRNRKSVKRENV